MERSNGTQDTATCQECGDVIEGWEYSSYTVEELGVCSGCWWDELDASERKEFAEQANEKRRQRRE